MAVWLWGSSTWKTLLTRAQRYDGGDAMWMGVPEAEVRMVEGM